MDQCGTSHRETVDIDDMESYMIKNLTYYRSSCKDHDQGRKLCTIPRVPKHIKLANKLLYEPKVLSVGPYYHGNTTLHFMERLKWDCLDYVLKQNTRKKLEDYLTVLESVERKARSCYSEEATMESNMFLRMLLLDGCFIIVYLCGTNALHGNTHKDNGSSSPHLAKQNEIMEHDRTTAESTRGSESSSSPTQSVDVVLIDSGKLRHSYEDPNQSRRDPVMLWYNSHALRDLMLLENQLPFFVVKRIYELLAGEKNVELLTETVCQYVKDNVRKYTTTALELDGKEDFGHLLQLCHKYFRPHIRPQHQQKASNKWFHTLQLKYFKLSYNSEETCFDQQSYCINVDQAPKRWRRAEQYHEAGIEFKRKENDEQNPHSLLDITFYKGEVEMPCLLIEENTACLLRNLVAFEQACPQFGNDLSAYMVLISQLASTPSDVALLARKGIIIHHMRTDDEVSTLFSNLGKNLDFDLSGTYYLKSVCHMMEEYYQNRINRWMAWLWHNHLKNPWLVLAVLAAAVVLLCTILQSLLALLSYLDQIEDTNKAANHDG
ncbi:unnamed protein product [Urochloa decumbens]|uniref:Uncharacterized protein n=1 Tax=Urochloa decumbens TaxID=240449 RepID=A0ABC8ZPG3_9POAL